MATDGRIQGVGVGTWGCGPWLHLHGPDMGRFRCAFKMQWLILIAVLPYDESARADKAPSSWAFACVHGTDERINVPLAMTMDQLASRKCLIYTLQT